MADCRMSDVKMTRVKIDRLSVVELTLVEVGGENFDAIITDVFVIVPVS